MCYVTSVVFYSMQPYGLQLVRLLCSWNSPGKNTGVGCHLLLQASGVLNFKLVTLRGLGFMICGLKFETPLATTKVTSFTDAYFIRQVDLAIQLEGHERIQ